MLKNKGQKDYSNYNKGGGKRNKLSFLRDGMILTFSIKRPGPSTNLTPNQKRDGYVFVDIKEFVEGETYNSYNSIEQNKQERDVRFIILNPTTLTKILLLDPKIFITPNQLLQEVEITQKGRQLLISQNKNNKYEFVLEIITRDESGAENKINSQIELNPEDIVLLKIFVESCIRELINI